MTTKAPMDGHHEVVEAHHRFTARTVGAEVWDFDHLEAFAMKVSLELVPSQFTEIDVVVLFSNHCFSRSLGDHEVVDESLIVMDGSETRVLDKERYDLSKLHLQRVIWSCPTGISK